MVPKHGLLKTIGGGSAIFTFLILSCSMRLAAQQEHATGDWNAWKFLIGEWVGTGTGNPGEGSGGFTFTPDLQNAVLVRKNIARYPATASQPAFVHEDLMMIYRRKAETRAVYFDSEHHIIAYGVSFSPDSNSIVFTSDTVVGDARYRLTYKKSGDRTVDIVFEIAPPGQPEAFAHYITASARKKE